MPIFSWLKINIFLFGFKKTLPEMKTMSHHFLWEKIDIFLCWVSLFWTAFWEITANFLFNSFYIQLYRACWYKENTFTKFRHSQLNVKSKKLHTCHPFKLNQCNATKLESAKYFREKFAVTNPCTPMYKFHSFGSGVSDYLLHNNTKIALKR